MKWLPALTMQLVARMKRSGIRERPATPPDFAIVASGLPDLIRLGRMGIVALLLSISVASASAETKSFVRGSQQSIVSSHQGKPFILALWSLDCTHCIDDMVLFGKLAKKYRDFNLVLVSTDAPEQMQAIARTLGRYRLGHAESWVFADSYAERLRFEVDPQWYGELPRTYFFDAEGHSTAVSGKIGRKQIERWIRDSKKHIKKDG